MKRLLIFILILSSAGFSFCCQCDTQVPFEEYVKSSQEIFIGMPIKEECTYRIDSISGHARTTSYTTTFEVIEKFKGSNHKILQVTRGSNSCDAHFFNGSGLYLVFAHSPRRPDSLSNDGLLLDSSQCSPNGRLFERDWESRSKLKNEDVFNNIATLRNLFPDQIQVSKIIESEEPIEISDKEELDLFFYISILLSLIIVGLVIQKLTRAKAS